ncbi:MAG: cation:proton antiporter [Gemmatimonadota bacterium]
MVAGLAGGLVAHRLGQPPLIGYILGGVLVGPYGIGPSVTEIHDIELLAEIGVALLLFALGLELRFADLAPVRRLALIGGPLQIVLTSVAGWAFGEAILGWDRIPALWLGAAISLSSTMVVLKILMAQGRTGSLAGRAMIGLLVVQDLAVVPMLVGLPRLGDLSGALPALGWALLEAAAFIAAMILVGTRLMPYLLKQIVRWGSRELFIVSVVALGVGIGYGTYLFGLSFAFGSFVAGMVLSESEFSHQALGEIVPLRDVFSLLFFASAGMLFNPFYSMGHAVEVAGTIAFVVIVKAVVGGGLTRAFGYAGEAPWLVGLGLAQAGEFSFLVARTGTATGALSNDQYGLVLSVALATMVLSPALFRGAGMAYRAWRRLHPQAPEVESYDLPEEGLEDHVVLVGYGGSGRAAAEVMRKVGVPFVVIELDHVVAESARGVATGVVWGDASHPEVLAAAGVRRARMILIAVSEAVSVRLTVERTRRLNPQIRIVARALYPEHLAELVSLGVYEAVQPEFEAGLEMVRQALSQYGVPNEDIQRLSDAVRDDLYGPMWEGGLAERYQDILDELGHAQSAIAIKWATVAGECVAAEATLEELGVQGRTGAVVVAIVHGRTVDVNPGQESRLHAGDRVALLGTAEERAAGRALLERAREEKGATDPRSV